MFSKRSGSKGKGKGKRHFRRRRSTRHRRRTHNRKGGGKTELKAELDAMAEQWKKLTAHGAQVPYHVAQEFGQKRTELLTQLAALEPKDVREAAAAAFSASNSAAVKAFKKVADESSAAIQKQEADVMSQWYQGHDGNWYPRK